MDKKEKLKDYAEKNTDRMKSFGNASIFFSILGLIGLTFIIIYLIIN